MKEITPKKANIDKLALEVFLKTLEIAGGPRKLIELRNLTRVPSLLAASYGVVLQEEEKKTAEEISEFLGATTQSVRNMLRVDIEAVKKRLKLGLGEGKKLVTHVAGGLAKIAFKEVKKEKE